MSSEASLRARIAALELERDKLLIEKEEDKKKQQKMQTKEDERHLLANGEYFAQLKDVLDTDKVDFTGGFRAICGRIDGGNAIAWRKGRFPSYESLELELLAKVASAEVTADNMSYASVSVSSKEHISQWGGHGNLTKEEKAVIEKARKKWKNRAVNSSGASRNSEDSSVNSDTGVKIVDSGVVTNTGHLIAGNDSCSPTMGIFVQAIIGKDFEAKMDSQIRTVLNKQGHSVDQLIALGAKKKKILQHLAYHQRDYKGFCNLENNVVQVPKGGHEKFFDEDCVWIVVPIMPLQEIIDWHYGKGGYWVMFIAGSFEKRDTAAYINFLQASRSAKEGEHVYVAGQREKCTRAEADEGIRNLTAFIKAFADLATGRGEKKMTPFDLIADNTRKRPPNLPALKAAAAKLADDGEVTVPILKDFEEQDLQILKVFIDHDDLSVLPEPMAFAAKGCLNVMEMTGEKATPGCGEASIITNESDASYIEQSSSVTPEKKSDIPEFVCVITP